MMRRIEQQPMKRTFIQTVQNAFRLLWKDIKDIKWAIIVVIAYFVLAKNYLYSLCPMVVITGFPCPGCGLTRAGLGSFGWILQERFKSILSFILLWSVWESLGGIVISGIAGWGQGLSFCQRLFVF